MSNLTLRPTSDGDLDELLGTFADVDEGGVGDGDATRVTNISAGAYKKDLYEIPDHTSESGTINNVKVYFRMRTDITGGGNDYSAYGKALIKTGGTEYLGDEQIESDENYNLFSHTWTDNPKTSVAWTWSDIDALQIGVALHGDTDSYAYCTQVWVEVDYEGVTKGFVG